MWTKGRFRSTLRKYGRVCRMLSLWRPSKTYLLIQHGRQSMKQEIYGKFERGWRKATFPASVSWINQE